MDDRLKRRLIGAAVLASLAVIFVPMLVEDEPVPGGDIGTTGIPPREDLTFKSQVLRDEVTVPTDAPPPVEPAEPAPELAAPPVAVAPAPDVTPTTAEPPPAPMAPAAVPEAPAAKPEPAPSAPETAAPTPAPKPPPPKPAEPTEVAKAAPPKPSAPTEAAKATPPSKPPPSAPARTGSKITTWIVQVGNFSTRAKADEVKRQLEGRGLEAFVEPIGKPAVFRVAVGPEADRKRAEALIPRVEAALPSGEKPFIRAYP